jgi:hypothetical protein
MEENRTDDKPTAESPPARKRRKFGWKQLVVAVVALVIIWQVAKAVIDTGNGASTTGSSRPSAAPSSVPPRRPTPVPTVTLGGHAVAAGGGPIILVNPGLVAPGGQVVVQGSGFNPGASVAVWLEAGHSSKGSVVAHGMASRYGTLNTGFTMPDSVTDTAATVVAQQAGGGETATAQIVTPMGVGRVAIDGKAAGKPGDTVTISASGFGPGENVDVYWGRVAGTPVATLTADGSGSIGQASVQVGVAPVGPTTLVLVGQKTKTTATAPYQMLGLYPVIEPHPYAVQAGHSATLVGSGFAPGEQVLVYLNAASGTPALTATASSDGNLSLSFVVPFGLKGSQTLTAIGEESRAAVDSGFDVLPYSPVAEASTYGAMPGTSISFYASGFAANEVVKVYLGRGQGDSGQLVSAFRVNSLGSAAAAGSYVIPNGTGPGLYFTLVGQESGGSAVAKVSVTAPSQPVNVPSQPPYVLPPSLGGKPSSTSPASQPPASQPAASQPAASQPAASQPAASQPAASQPAASQPAASQPAASQPPASQPPASQPPASQPPASQPSPNPSAS